MANNTTRYNVIGYYTTHNDWCLICLGTNNKEQMLNTLEDVKNNPKAYGVMRPEDVAEYKLDEIVDTPDNWWNKNID